MGSLGGQFVKLPTGIIIVLLILVLLLIGYFGVFWAALLGIQKQNGVPGFSLTAANVVFWINICFEILTIIVFLLMIWGFVVHLNTNRKEKHPVQETMNGSFDGSYAVPMMESPRED